VFFFSFIKGGEESCTQRNAEDILLRSERQKREQKLLEIRKMSVVLYVKVSLS